MKGKKLIRKVQMPILGGGALVFDFMLTKREVELVREVYVLGWQAGQEAKIERIKAGKK